MTKPGASPATLSYHFSVQALLINLGELPEEGQKFAGELSPEIFGLPEGDARPLGPLAYDLYVQRFENELLFRGSLQAAFEFTCVRTLTRFKQTLTLPEAAISLEIKQGGEIDATEALREELLINFPEYPRCDEGDEPMDCEIDPRYLAVDKPASDDVESPPARDGDSRWDALDAFDTPPDQS